MYVCITVEYKLLRAAEAAGSVCSNARHKNHFFRKTCMYACMYISMYVSMHETFE